MDLIIPPKLQLALDARSDLDALIGDAPNRLIASTSPLRDVRVDLEIPTGLTITEMLDVVGMRPVLHDMVNVWLCDKEMRLDPVFVPQRNWALVRPRPGIVVTLRCAPTKGGGGGKSSMGLLARIAIIAASIAVSFIQPYGVILAPLVPFPGTLYVGATLERKQS